MLSILDMDKMFKNNYSLKIQYGPFSVDFWILFAEKLEVRLSFMKLLYGFINIKKVQNALKHISYKYFPES